MANFIYQLVRIIRALKWRGLDLLSTAYYRVVCGSLGQGSKVCWGTWISSPGMVFIGNNVRVGRNCRIFTENSAETLRIEDRVQINDYGLIDFTGGLEIKCNALISEGVKVYTHSHGRDPRAPAMGFKKVIGVSAWIGADSIVMHSCELIGELSIVGAGVVLTSDVSDGQVVVGQSVRRIS